METGSFISDCKSNWRGWVWNRIIERIPTLDCRYATGLYLVGPDDLDREAALKKGLRNHNLIAVDKDINHIRNVRAAGNLGIQGRLQDILVVWPQDWPITFVNADMCCGLDDNMRIFTAALIICRGFIPAETVIAVNLQRGRDPASNPLRSGIKQSYFSRGMTREEFQRKVKRSDERLMDIVLDEKHRGKQFFNRLLFHSLDAARQVPGQEHLNKEQNGFANQFVEATNPQFHSYRQNVRVPYMDSVVFTMPPFVNFDHEADIAFYKDWTQRDLKKTINRVAALRAVRTMKMKELKRA